LLFRDQTSNLFSPVYENINIFRTLELLEELTAVVRQRIGDGHALELLIKHFIVVVVVAAFF
jgi:hypothetical protein